MAAPDTSWKVLEHGPVVTLADNLRWVSGSLPNMSLRRTMTAVRLASGELLLYSAIAMDEGAMQQLEAWGRPSWLVVPNYGHRLDAPRYKARYPEIRVVTPPGSRTRVEEQVHVDHTTAEVPLGDDSCWFEPLHGVGDAEAAMFVRSADGVTLVLNDVVFNMDPKQDWLGWAITTALGSAPGPRVSRLTKLVFVQDRRALRADLERFAERPDLVRLIVAHEKVASGPDARAALRQAATYL